MPELQIIVSVLNTLGFAGVGIFLWFLYKGLNERINNLTLLTQEQSKTLEAVRDRATEIDRLKDLYKQAVTDISEMGEKLEKRRKELLTEYEKANERKDQELARYAHLQLEEIELQRKSLERLPQLEKRLDDTVSELKTQIKILKPQSSSSMVLEDVDFMVSTILEKYRGDVPFPTAGQIYHNLTEGSSISEAIARKSSDENKGGRQEEKDGDDSP